MIIMLTQIRRAAMAEMENAPYVHWLEESVGAIIDFKPDSMALVAMRDEDGMR